MKGPLRRKVFAFVVAMIYTATQVMFASATESNFWTERRQAIPQLANLPSTLPPIRSALATISASNASQKIMPHMSSELRDVVSAIPSDRATVQDVYDSGNKTAAPVVLVQDVHLNAEAQANIAGVLQNLIDQQKIGRV